MSFNITSVQKSNINIATTVAGSNDGLGLADSNELTPPAFAPATCGEDNAVTTVAEDNSATSEGTGAVTGTDGAVEAVSEADAAPATAKRAKPKARRAGKHSAAKTTPKGLKQKCERVRAYLLAEANGLKSCKQMSEELGVSLPFIRKVRAELVAAGLVPAEALGPRRPGVRKAAPQVAHDTVADGATSALSQPMTDAEGVVRVDCECIDSEPAPAMQSCCTRGSLRSVRITALVGGAIGAAALLANRLLGAAFRN